MLCKVGIEQTVEMYLLSFRPEQSSLLGIFESEILLIHFAALCTHVHVNILLLQLPLITDFMIKCLENLHHSYTDADNNEKHLKMKYGNPNYFSF